MDIINLVNNDFVKRDGIWIDTAKEVLRIQQMRKELEKKESILLAKLKDLSERTNSKGGGFVFSCWLRKGNIDYNAIPELKNIDLEQYRKQSCEVWKLSLELEL